MSRLPIVDSKTFEKILLKLGFYSYPSKRKPCILQASGWQIHNIAPPSWKRFRKIPHQKNP
jgi:hypothetical protein